MTYIPATLKQDFLPPSHKLITLLEQINHWDHYVSPKFFRDVTTVSFEIQGNLLIAKFYKTKPRYLEESSTILKGTYQGCYHKTTTTKKMNSYTAKQQILTLPM